jgi:hypothetical protein
MSKIRKENAQIEPLRELIRNHNIKNESISKNNKSQKEYLSLVNKLCETGSYHIIKDIPRYIFETLKDGIIVIDLVSKSNDSYVSYEEITFCTLKDQYYGLSMGYFNFTVTKEEAYSFYNIIKLMQMKYPYTISKTENNTCYIIIDSTGNKMGFFNTYEEANNFQNSSLTYIDNVNDINASDNSN